MTIKIKICLSLVIIFISSLLGNSVFAVSTLPTGGSNFAQATVIGAGEYQGTLAPETDAYYQIEIKAGQELDVKGGFGVVGGENTYSAGKTYLYDGNKEERDYLYGGGGALVSYLSNSKQNMYIRMVNEETDQTLTYNLEITVQNRFDANSQTDAGDTFEEALLITPGNYKGYLAGVSVMQTPYGNDFKDYYKISVQKGIPYEFKLTPPLKNEGTLELYDLNRQSIDETYSPNEGAIVSLSLTPTANTNVFLAVSCGYTSGIFDYKMDINSSVSLTTTTTLTPTTTLFPPQSECNLNQTKCFDNFNYQKCGNYDKDEYLEWSTPVYCGENNKCENGKCVKAKDCQCSAWVNEACAGNDCQESEMYQTRTCEPKNCDKEEQCLTDATCKTTAECSKNSDCPKGFICKTGECITKEGGWWGRFSLFGLGGLFIGWYFWLYLILWFALYIYLALCLQILAEKTNTPNSWLAWIPIANIFLMLQIARKPLWWFVLLLIPIVNIVIAIIIWMKIAERIGKPSWLGVLLIVPVIGIAIPGYLAFSGGEKIEPIPPYASIGTEAANKPTVGYKHPCKYCGKLIPPNSAVCPLCGKVNPLGPYRCPKCHEPVEKDWQVCSHCGQNLRIVCPKCGKITFFGDYCEDCGARLLVACPHCGQDQPPLSDKCIKCGQQMQNKK